MARALKYLEIRKVPVGCVVVSGGVASNKYLKDRLTTICATHNNIRLAVPPIKYCTDNGLMIAWNGLINKLIY